MFSSPDSGNDHAVAWILLTIGWSNPVINQVKIQMYVYNTIKRLFTPLEIIRVSFELYKRVRCGRIPPTTETGSNSARDLSGPEKTVGEAQVTAFVFFLFFLSSGIVSSWMWRLGTWRCLTLVCMLVDPGLPNTKQLDDILTGQGERYLQKLRQSIDMRCPDVASGRLLTQGRLFYCHLQACL